MFRIVRVKGAIVTWERTFKAGVRVSSSTGRRPAGAGRFAHQISPCASLRTGSFPIAEVFVRERLGGEPRAGRCQVIVGARGHGARLRSTPGLLVPLPRINAQGDRVDERIGLGDMPDALEPGMICGPDARERRAGLACPGVHVNNDNAVNAVIKPDGRAAAYNDAR